MVNNRKILLLDTPGFDDSAIGNLEVLNEIASNLYTFALEPERFETQGVIFLHDISENRFAGSQRKTLEILTALCGPKALSNCIIGTTMWSPSGTVKFGNEELREKEFLRSHWEGFLKTTRILEGDRNAVVGIINDILTCPPSLLRVQQEMLMPPHTLDTTTVGKIAIPEGRAEAEKLRKEFEEKQRVFREERENLQMMFARETSDFRLRSRAERANEETERRRIDAERSRRLEEQEFVYQEDLRNLDAKYRRHAEDEERRRRVEDEARHKDERNTWQKFIQEQQDKADRAAEDREMWFDRERLRLEEEAKKANQREEERIRLLREEFKKTMVSPPKPKWWEPVIGIAVAIFTKLF